MTVKFLKYLITNVCRFLLAITFIFSGFVKAVDPLGTLYKITDYLEAMHIAEYIPDYITLAVSILLSALEFSLGILLLFAIRRRIVSRIILAFISVMTIITLWIVMIVILMKKKNHDYDEAWSLALLLVMTHCV